MSEPCPDRNRLRSYSLGTLASETAVALEAHVTECFRCQDRLESLEGAADDLIVGLRGAQDVPPAESDSGEIRLADLIASAKFLASTRADDGRPKLDLSFAVGAGDSERERIPNQRRNERRAAEVLPASADDLSDGIRRSKVIAEDELAGLLEQFLRESEGSDALSLARWLVEQGRLTPFQAAELCRGRADELLLGDYVLVDEIGHGGMGRVYQAHHVRMGRDAAIKILAPHLFEEPGSVERFGREILAIASLSHPNVVAAYDAREYHHTQYLVMEDIDGATLASIVERQGPLSIDEGLNAILQAAEGLEAAHEKGIIHRDVKPSNLLVTWEGRVKVSDLGLARMVLSTEGVEELTETGQILGTLAYISPEQAQNQADARSDIYSLGWTLFFLLAGEAPFAGETRLGKLMAHRDAERPSLRDFRDDVPEDVDQLYRQMVEIRPEDRPQSMGEVIKRLRILLVTDAVVKPTPALKLKTCDLDIFFRDLELETGEARKREEEAQAIEQKRRIRRRTLAVSALLPLVALIAFGIHALIIRAETPEGEVVIRVNDLDVEKMDIRVQQGDKDVMILDSKSGWSVRLPKGTYSMSIGKGDERFKLNRNVIDVTPNSTQHIEVRIRQRQATKEPVESVEREKSNKLYGVLARIDACDRGLLMRLSPDTQTAYILGDDDLIYVVDLRTRSVTRRINNERFPISYFAISHDGKRMATTGGSVDAYFRLWDVANGKPLVEHRLPVPPRFVEFSPDDRTVFVSMWAPAGNATFPLRGDAEDTFRSLMRFDAQTARPLKPITEERRTVFYAMTLSPNGKMVATGGIEGNIVVRDASTGESLQEFAGHGQRGPVRALHFSSDSRRLYSSEFANRLICRTVENGEIIFERLYRFKFGEFDLTDDEKVFALTSRPELRLYDRQRQVGDERIDIKGHATQPIRVVKFLADDRSAVSMSLDGTVRIWKLPIRLGDDKD
ncbi:MAG: protein kinase [Planctomycetes bacterium]|nr:protein kinase [Planctomycetota bacterium]